MCNIWSNVCMKYEKSHKNVILLSFENNSHVHCVNRHCFEICNNFEICNSFEIYDNKKKNIIEADHNNQVSIIPVTSDIK